MIKSIFYKEWLKIRRVSQIMLLVGIVVIAGIYFTVRHDLIVTDAEIYWDRITGQRMIYYSILKFLPLLTGVIVALAQFIPEIIDKRIKLTLHLPLNEEKGILQMMLFGAVTLLAVYTVELGLFWGWGAVYFPDEIIFPSLLTLLPWFISGIAAYFFLAMIVLEPVWKYRIFYILVAALFVQVFYLSDIAAAYSHSLLLLLALTMLISISLLYSIYRFRKGEM